MVDKNAPKNLNEFEDRGDVNQTFDYQLWLNKMNIDGIDGDEFLLLADKNTRQSDKYVVNVRRNIN